MSEDNGPTPIEHERDGGGLDVEHSSHIRDATATVEADDRDLYELLMEVLADVWVPDLMPAHLAIACDDLMDVRETVTDIKRGSVILDGLASYDMGYCHRARDAIDEYRDRGPLNLVAVGCSGSKHDDADPLPARDRYKGAYWSCKRDYGETTGDQWRIISAEYGLLDPDETIPNYERTPDDLDGVPVHVAEPMRLPNGDGVTTLLDRSAIDVYHGLSAWLQEASGDIDPRDVRLEVLIGRKYRDPLEERGVFEALRAPGQLDVAFPFQEAEQAQGGNGNQMGWMTDEVAGARGDA